MKEATYAVFGVMLLIGLAVVLLVRRAAREAPTGGMGLGPPAILGGVLTVVGALGLIMAALTW